MMPCGIVERDVRVHEMAEDDVKFDMSQLEASQPEPEKDEADEAEIDEKPEDEESEPVKESDDESDDEQDESEVKGWDKGLQKTQQNVASLQRSLESLNEKIERLASQGVTSAKEKQAIEDLQEKADEIEEQLDPDDILTVAQADRRAQKIADAALEKYKKQQQEEREQAEQSARQNAEAVEKFIASYEPPDKALKGKGKDVWDEYSKEVAKTPSYVRMSKQDQAEFLRDRFEIAENRVLGRVKSAVPEKPARKPSNVPDKSPEGTRSVNSSVANPKAANKGLAPYLEALRPS